MNFIFTGKNIEITQALKEQTEKKLGKLEKFFKPDTDVQVTMTVQKNRHIVEVTVFFNGVFIRAEESNHDMYTSLDKVIDKMERQIRKNKTKLKKKLHGSGHTPEFYSTPNTSVDEEEEEFKLVKTKRFAIKPMDAQEAILQMNLLGHEFFVFHNAETEEVSVVYKRKDGNYGLIESEF